MSFKYFPLSSEQTRVRKAAWEGLGNKKPFGRAAVCLCNFYPDIDEIDKQVIPEKEIPLAGPVRRDQEWDNEIRWQIRALHLNACSSYQDDLFPAITIPRHVHKQSQGLAEIFGCRLIEHEKEQGLFYPVPSIKIPLDVDRLKILPVEECFYVNALKFAEYAWQSADGQLYIRNPVITGPIDTVNYVLGTMRLMEWIYEEPAALHKLLDITTDVLIDIILKLQKATEGHICTDHSFCVDRGFTLCSEIRHLISKELYEEFEAPYLSRIGRACGPYMVHSCGTWERTLPSLMQDTNLMMLSLNSKEMDMEKVYEITKNQLSMNIIMSYSVDEKYLWPDYYSFLKYIMTVFPESIPLEMMIFSEDDMRVYLDIQDELDGGRSGMFRWMKGR